jgi:hypothetical protein
MASALGAGVITTLAVVLALAGAAKLRQPASASGGLTRMGAARALVAVRGLAVAELAVALLALCAPARISGLVLAVMFAAFAVTHVQAWRSGGVDCGCFGDQTGAAVSPRRAVLLTGGAAGVAAAIGVAEAPSLAGLASSRPAAALWVALAASLGALCWRLAFTGASIRPAAAGDRLVASSALFLERRFSRRKLLVRIAVAGSALSVAPLRYLLYPGTALAQISPGDCSGGECTDGFTAFCCQINRGLNSCPTGTYPGGWWMCTDYTGGLLCAPQGVRYYVDCNALPGSEFPGGCRCAHGSCDNQRVACNVFRYGQCNTEVGGVTAVVCRMVVCENPGSIPGLNCGYSVAVDDSVCGQDTPCLTPEAVELPGAGGV